MWKKKIVELDLVREAGGKGVLARSTEDSRATSYSDVNCKYLLVYLETANKKSPLKSNQRAEISSCENQNISQQ